MRALVIDEVAKEEIARVRKYADEHFITREQLMEMIANETSAIGDDPNHVCHFQKGFRCVLSVEQQPNGWCRHLSVSIDKDDKLPHVSAVQMLMPEFGLDKPMDECFVYIEESIPKSVNIICPI